MYQKSQLKLLICDTNSGTHPSIAPTFTASLSALLHTVIGSRLPALALNIGIGRQLCAAASYNMKLNLLDSGLNNQSSVSTSFITQLLTIFISWQMATIGILKNIARFWAALSQNFDSRHSNIQQALACSFLCDLNANSVIFQDFLQKTLSRSIATDMPHCVQRVSPHLHNMSRKKCV